MGTRAGIVARDWKCQASADLAFPHRASHTWHLLSWTASRRASLSSPSCVPPGALIAAPAPPSGTQGQGRRVTGVGLSSTDYLCWPSSSLGLASVSCPPWDPSPCTSAMGCQNGSLWAYCQYSCLSLGGSDSALVFPAAPSSSLPLRGSGPALAHQSPWSHLYLHSCHHHHHHHPQALPLFPSVPPQGPRNPRRAVGAQDAENRGRGQP